jgi:SpoVK/Ycf46/Vps4 family AAA+-type ATPase
MTQMIGLLVFLAVLAYAARRRWTRIQRETMAFLGKERNADTSVLMGERFETPFIPDLKRALRDHLPALGLKTELHGVNGLCHHPGSLDVAVSIPNLLAGAFVGSFGAIASKTYTTGPDSTEALPEGVLVECRGGPFPLLLMLMVDPLDGRFYLEGVTQNTPEASDWAKEILKSLDTWAKQNSYFKAGTLKSTFEYHQIKGLEFVSVGSTAVEPLDDSLTDQLDLNLLSFVRHRDVLSAVGVASNRGLFLCGPPGTGKTTTCRYLRQQLPDHTFLLVGAEGVMSIRAVFSIARRLAPTVLILEDVDLMFPSREMMGMNPPLMDLLNEMDGLQPRELIHVILTSNSWSFVETALADRPCRIDQVIFFEVPGPVQRLRLLKRFLEKMEVAAEMQAISDLMPSLTPAEMSEIVKKAAVLATRRGSPEKPLPPLILQDFREALALQREGSRDHKARKPVGLRPGLGSRTAAVS